MSEGVEEESAGAKIGTEMTVEVKRVRRIDEVPQTPGERITAEEGGRGASNEIRTTMAEMKVGVENMEEGKEAEVKQDNAEAEE